jgi:hypothetical protein
VPLLLTIIGAIDAGTVRTSSLAVKSCFINLHILDMYLRTVIIDFDTSIDANPAVRLFGPNLASGWARIH